VLESHVGADIGFGAIAGLHPANFTRDHADPRVREAGHHVAQCAGIEQLPDIGEHQDLAPGALERRIDRPGFAPTRQLQQLNPGIAAD
jgi:hypothetical protein